MVSIGLGRATSLSLAAAATCLSVPAWGQGRTAQARGDVEIVGTVSTSAIFEIGTDLLTAIFVTGQAGDTVSMFTPASAASWRTDPSISPNQVASLDDVTILSHGTVSINLQRIKRAAGPPGSDDNPGTILVLAQFN